MKPTGLRRFEAREGSLIYGGPLWDGHVVSICFRKDLEGGAGMWRRWTAIGRSEVGGQRDPRAGSSGLGTGHRSRQSRALGGGRPDETATVSLPRRYAVHVIVTPDVGGKQVGRGAQVARVGRVSTLVRLGCPRSPSLPLIPPAPCWSPHAHLFNVPPFKRGR